MNFLPMKKYKVDLTGTSPDNRVMEERHQVSPAYNVLIPVHAPFFRESLVITYNGKQLTEGRDYEFADLDADATTKANKSIYTTVVFRRQDIQGEVWLNYQTYGDGNYAGVISKYIELLLKDNRGVNWEDIFNKPAQYPPMYHTHHVRDIRGIWPIVVELQAIKRAIEYLRYKGNVKLKGEILGHIALLNEKFDTYRRAVDGALNLEEFKAEVRGLVPDILDETMNGLRNEVQRLTAEVEHLGQQNSFQLNAQSFNDIYDGIRSKIDALINSKNNTQTIPWERVTGAPERFPTNWENILGKPDDFSTTWDLVKNKPLVYQTRWDMVTNRPVVPHFYRSSEEYTTNIDMVDVSDNRASLGLLSLVIDRATNQFFFREPNVPIRRPFMVDWANVLNKPFIPTARGQGVGNQLKYIFDLGKSGQNVLGISYITEDVLKFVISGREIPVKIDYENVKGRPEAVSLRTVTKTVNDIDYHVHPDKSLSELLPRKEGDVTSYYVTTNDTGEAVGIGKLHFIVFRDCALPVFTGGTTPAPLRTGRVLINFKKMSGFFTYEIECADRANIEQCVSKGFTFSGAIFRTEGTANSRIASALSNVALKSPHQFSSASFSNNGLTVPGTRSGVFHTFLADKEALFT